MGDVDPQGIALEDEQTLSCAYSPTGRCVAVGYVNLNLFIMTHRHQLNYI